MASRPLPPILRIRKPASVWRYWLRSSWEKRFFLGPAGSNEAQTRAQFIDEFFIILGWDVRNEAQVFLYRQEVAPETRLKASRTILYADYGFQVGGRAEFYVEAKAANQKLSNPKPLFQAARYAWSFHAR